MDADDTCDVVVLGFDPGPETPAERLQRAFGIERATAEALLSRLPATVQRGVSSLRADYFRRGLIAIGAQVELRTKAGVLVPLVVGAPAEPSPPARSGATPRVATLSQPAPPRSPRPISVRPSSPTLIQRASQSPALAATEPPPGAALPAAAPLLAWSAPDPALPALHTIDPMSATLAQLGAVRPEDLRSTPRPPFVAVPAAAPPPVLTPPVIAGSAHATLREAVPAPAFIAPAAPAPAPAPALLILSPPFVTPEAAHPRAASIDQPALHVSRDPSSVFDPPPAQVHPPRPQALTLPSADPADAAAFAVLAAIPAPPAYGELTTVPMPTAARGRPAPAPDFSAGYESLGSGPAVATPAPLLLDLSPIADDPFDVASKHVLQAWEQPDDAAMAEPKARSSRAPHARALGQSPRQRLLPESLPAPGEAAPPAWSRPAPGPATGVADREQPRGRAVVAYDPRTFWQTIGEALALPFTGSGLLWIAAIALWSVFVSLVGLLCSFMFVTGLAIMFMAQTSLIAFACDYYRVCLWVPVVGEKVLDVKPSFDPNRILDRYVRSGMHLSLFAIASQIPVIAWLATSAVDGRAFLDTLMQPVTWALFALPYVYWPMAVGLTALGNDFSAIWNVLAGFRAIARAPLEYALIATIGLGSLVLSWSALMWGGTALGVSGAVLSGTVGIPLAISHGIQGALMGHLARARGEVFE